MALWRAIYLTMSIIYFASRRNRNICPLALPSVTKHLWVKANHERLLNEKQTILHCRKRNINVLCCCNYCYFLLIPVYLTDLAHIRLTGGDDQKSRGKLEIHYNNHWGGVCWSHWTLHNTNVVCRMLHYRFISMCFETYFWRHSIVCTVDYFC